MWPFTDSWPLDMRFFVLNRRRDIPPHRPSHFEIIHVDSGEIVYEAQGKTSLVKNGDIIVVGNRLHHRHLKTDHMRPQIRATILYFTPGLFQAWCPPADGYRYLMPFLYQGRCTPHVIPAGTRIPSKVIDLFHDLWPIIDGASPQSRLAARAYVQMILVLLLNHYSESRETKEGFAQAYHEMQFFLPLVEFLEANYSRPIGLEDGAHVLGMSKCRFARFIKRTTGHAFLQFLNHFRIEKAKALLARTQKPISELCQEVGFCDQSYFGYVFRRLVTVTPLQYRQENWCANRAITSVLQQGSQVQRISLKST